MAEHHIDAGLSPTPGVPLGAEDGLNFEIELISRHLDMLILEGAELCFPATVVQAKLRQNRIARQWYGGLEYDAVNDIIIQRKLLARLERQLNYVKHHDVSVLPVIEGDTIPGEIGKKLTAC